MTKHAGDAGEEGSEDRDQAEEGDLACKGETLVLLNAIGTGEEIEGTDDLLEMIVIVPEIGRASCRERV